jgi:hypothetical protein
MVYGVVTSDAWFSEVETNPGGMITAGSLDIELTGGPLKAVNLQPGRDFSEMGAVCARNAGSMDLKYRALFKPDSFENIDLVTYLTLKIEKKADGQWEPYKEVSGEPSNKKKALSHYFQTSRGQPEESNLYLMEGVLSPSGEDCYRFWIKLSSETPNAMQRKGMDFSLYLYATQEENPGWE